MNGVKRLLLMGVPGSGGISNTVAPAVTATSVIGTANTATPGTWTGSPTLTYQWQRYTSGAWVDISGATNAAYTPVDADFGLSLRVAEIPNGNVALAVYSNATGLTAEAPAQTIGPTELLTNGDFAAWTGDNPNGWTLTAENATNYIAEATGAARMVSDGALLGMGQTVLTSGDWFEILVDVTNVTAGGIKFFDGVGGGGGVLTGHVMTTTGTHVHLIRSYIAGGQLWLYRNSGATDVTVDNATCKKNTINTQLVAPSADMVIDALFTLPVSPKEGTTYVLLTRISNYAAGNYWRAELIYSGGQWNITLYSMASFVRTQVAVALNIGVANGIRLRMSNEAISLFTTANGGTNWTQRDTDKTSALYKTSTGVNAVWTSDITPGQIVYANP